MAAKHEMIINDLQFKVDKLLALYSSVVENNKNLLEELEDFKRRLREKEEQNKILENKLNIAKLAGSLSGNNGGEEAKRRIVKLVKEVDKCISLLND